MNPAYDCDDPVYIDILDPDDSDTLSSTSQFNITPGIPPLCAKEQLEREDLLIIAFLGLCLLIILASLVFNHVL